MVYIGSLLKLPIAGHAEQFILEAAHTRWNKEGTFQWTNYPEDKEIIGDWVLEEAFLQRNPAPLLIVLDCCHASRSRRECTNVGLETNYLLPHDDTTLEPSSITVDAPPQFEKILASIPNNGNLSTIAWETVGPKMVDLP
jgi:hypothetical protein